MSEAKTNELVRGRYSRVRRTDGASGADGLFAEVLPQT